MIEIGQIYELKKDILLSKKQENGVKLIEKFIVRHDSYVTIIDCEFLGERFPDKWNGKRKFYRIKILYDNKIGYLNQIDHVLFKRKFRFIGTE